MAAGTNHYLPGSCTCACLEICVAVTGSDASDMVEKAEAIVRDNTFIEFRLDYLPQPVSPSQAQRIHRIHPHVSSIATCRRAASGGKFQRLHRGRNWRFLARLPMPAASWLT